MVERYVALEFAPEPEQQVEAARACCEPVVELSSNAITRSRNLDSASLGSARPQERKQHRLSRTVVLVEVKCV